MAGRKNAPSNDTEGENWTDIPGFEGYYQASSLGRVRTITVRQQFESETGYMRLRLAMPDGGTKTQSVHRLVCAAFHGPPPDGRYDVAHLDGNPKNNRPENLRWATRKENMADQLRHETFCRGASRHNAKLTEDDVRWIRSQPRSKSNHSLATELGVDHQTVRQVRLGITWKHIE